MEVEEQATGAGRPGERFARRVELWPAGDWRRWLAVDRRDRQVVLLSRRSDTLAGQDAPSGVSAAARLRHPALARVLGWGRDAGGLWVVEELRGARPLDDSACRLPRGERLAEALVSLLEAIAYLHRHGISHGRVARSAVVSDGQALALTGAALGERSGDDDRKRADVRAWAHLATDLLREHGGTGPAAKVIMEAARAVVSESAPPAAGDAGRVAAAVRRAVGAAGGRSGQRRSGAASGKHSGKGGATGGVWHLAGSLLTGLLTTALTVGLVAGAVAVGMLLFASRLPKEVAVPNVVGLAQAEAHSALQEAGLRVGDVRHVYRDDVAAGEVAGTLPGPGMVVREGREIVLVVSLGAATVRVPRLIGLQLGEARSMAQRAGLGLQVAGRMRSAAPLGEIVRQEPAPGTEVAREEQILVHLSGGPQFGMVEVEDEDGEIVRLLFRQIEIVVPQGGPLQRLRVLEGYAEPLTATYDRLHRPGDKITFDTSGRAGKRIEVWIEGERVYRTQL